MGYNLTVNEPSGIRLMRLMDTQLLHIVKKELRNENRICLYGTGEYWVAFERSAYMLSQLFASSDISSVIHKEYPFPVVMASISDDELRGYGKHHIFHRDYLDYKEFICSATPRISYTLWYRNNVQEIKEYMSNERQSQIVAKN